MCSAPIRQGFVTELFRTANTLTTSSHVAYLRPAGRLVKLAKVQAVFVPGTTGLPRGSERPPQFVA
jgi:hypothetical protein